MKKTIWVATLIVMFSVSNLACSRRLKTPTLDDGSRIKLFVLSDRGDPSTMEEKQFNYRNQVGEWMEPDLIRVLNRSGYEATLIQKQEDYTPGAGEYLLKVKIVSYNPGSAAARIIVGFGAGAVSLDNHYELFNKDNKLLLAYYDGVGSSRGWRQCARKLNENAQQRITKKFTEIYKP